jgi:hypothetical protein
MIEASDRSDGQSAAAGRSDERAAELRRRVADVHVPERLARSESRLRSAGLLLPLVGLALIGVAWFQASGTPYLAEQIPYLISGALAGLGVVVIGVGLYVRYSLASILRFWLARLTAEHAAQTDRTVEALGRIEAILDAATNAAREPVERP